MKLSQGQTWLIGAALAALVAGAYTLERYAESTRTNYFSAQLSAAVVSQQVELGGKLYTVKNGAVYDDQNRVLSGNKALSALRLAYAVTLARRSPILALAGSDLARLDQAIDGLASLANGFAEVQKKTRERTLIENSLYPIGYLHAMTRTEALRRSFIQSGSDRDLALYQEAQHDSLLEYRDSLLRYQSAFMTLVPHTQKRYAMGESVVTYDSSLRAVAQLLESNSRTYEAWRRRTFCIQGSIAHCKTQDLLLPRIPQTHKQPVSQKSLAQALEIESMLARARDETVSPSMILVNLSESACSGRKDVAPLYSINEQVLPDSPFVNRQVTFVGDIRFIKSDQYRSVPFYDLFAQRQVAYIYTAVPMHYACPEFGRDVLRVFAVQAVRDFVHEHPLSLYVPADNARVLRMLEAAIDVPLSQPAYEADAGAYLAAALELPQETFPEDIRHKLLELSLQFSNESAGFEYAIQSIVRIENNNLAITDKGIPVDLEAPYVLFFRSALPLLYVSNNYSVTGGNGIPPYPAVPTDQQNPYVYYSTLPRTPAMLEKIMHDTRIYLRVHSRATSATTLEGLFVD